MSSSPFEIKFNKTDQARIIKKIEALKSNCNTLTGGPVCNIVLEYVTAYQNTIVEAMANIDGESGGSPTFKVKEMSQNTWWAPLTELTMNTKRDLGLSLSVWNATGKTRESVKIQEVHIPYRAVKFFAGIDKATNPAEYQKAINTEFGARSSTTDFKHDGGFAAPFWVSNWVARPLFTIANEVIKANSQNIANAVRSAVMSNVNWGA